MRGNGMIYNNDFYSKQRDHFRVAKFNMDYARKRRNQQVTANNTYK